MARKNGWFNPNDGFARHKGNKNSHTTGKREVAALVSIITGLDIKVSNSVLYSPPFSLRQYSSTSTPTILFLTGSNGLSYFKTDGSGVTNSAASISTPATEEQIVEFADKVWSGIESYELSKTFVKGPDKMVNTYLAKIKKEK